MQQQVDKYRPSTARRIRRIAIGGLAVAAASFPAAAQARFEMDSGGGVSAQTALSQAGPPAPRAPARHATPTAASSFHWGDAALGAAGAIVLIGGGALAVAAPRRRRAMAS
jgi:hypothetical protein